MNKGFAIALDALMAIILVTTMLVFLSQHPSQPLPGLETSLLLKQTSRHAFSTLEKSGALDRVLVEQAFRPGEGEETSAEMLYREARQILSPNLELKIRIRAFAADVDRCRENPSFESCFVPSGESVFSSTPLPENRDVVYGRRMLARASPGRGEVDHEIVCQNTWSESFDAVTSSLGIARLAVDDPPVLEVSAEAFPLSLACAASLDTVEENQVSRISVSVQNQSRNPVDVTLVVDSSASMRLLDVALQEKTVTVGGGTCKNGPCFATDQGIETNCGWDQPANQCNSVSSPFYDNDRTYASNWVLSDAAMNWLGTSMQSKLRFLQLPSYASGGACSRCGTPMLRVTRSDGRKGKWDSSSSNRVFFSRGPDGAFAGLQAGDSFEVKGWNSDAALSLGAIVIAEPNEAVDVKALGTIGFAEGTQCPFSFPTGCTAEQCGDFRRVESRNVPDSIPFATEAIIPETYRILQFSNPIDGACRPEIRVVFVPTGNGEPVFSSPRTCSQYSCATLYHPQQFSWERYPNYRANIPEGTYYFYVASPTPLENVQAKTFVRYFIEELSPPTSFSNGTCGGDACYYQIGATRNCPFVAVNQPNFFVEGSSNLTGTNEQVSDELQIREEQKLRALRVEQIFLQRQGNCRFLSAGLNTTLPGDTSNHVLTGVVPSGASVLFSHGINDSGQANNHVNLSFNGTIPPGTYRTKVWADETAIVQVRWLERRLDAAVEAAKRFVDNPNWKPEDRLGLVRFADSATTIHALQEATTERRAALKTALDEMDAEGETYTAQGIALAQQQLLSSATLNKKFMVILSDGRATLPSLESGGTEAILAAQVAREKNITVFTIGFGNEAIQWNGSQQRLECTQELNQIALYGGGVCYPAEDAEQLAEIYGLIATQIQQTVGTSHVQLPLYEGMAIRAPVCPDETGVCNGDCCLGGIGVQTHSVEGAIVELSWEEAQGANGWYQAQAGDRLVFKQAVMEQAEGWKGEFDATVLCNRESCVPEWVFPNENAVIETPDWNIVWPLDDQQGEPEQVRIRIQTQSVGLSLIEGRILTDEGKSFLSIQLENTGNQDFNFVNWRSQSCGVQAIPVQVKMNSLEPPTFGEAPVETVCLSFADNSACTGEGLDNGLWHPGQQRTCRVEIDSALTGFVYASVSLEEGQPPLAECRSDNWDKLYCVANNAAQFFVVDYWSWLK